MTEESQAILVTIEEAQRIMSLSRTKVYDLVREGELESVKIGRRRLIPTQAIETFIEGLRPVATQ